MLDIEQICRQAPVVPVLIIDRLEDAVPLAQALVSGGLPVLEITLRTAIACDAIHAVREACPDAVVGAGTVLTPDDVQRCIDSGAQFGVSPGATGRLMDAVAKQDFPFLPGCATPGEAMTLADRGYTMLKFFPAGAAGGVAMLKALASPLAGIKFCPTGGVSLKNAPEYLALPNVVTVGGSWVAPSDRIQAGDWDSIATLAREAVSTLTPG